jgi:protein-disulfide isomerase
MKSRAAPTSLIAVAVLWLNPDAALAQRPQLESVGFDKGDPDAPLVVVEFADFGCSACTQFALETFPALDSQLISTGRVRWKFIPFNLGAFKRSKEATVAAICAAEQNGFWQFHDLLFARRGEWQPSRKPQQAFQEIALAVGLDTLAFHQCYRDEDAEDRAKNLRKLAREWGVRGTPTFFVGEQKLEGAPPTDEFIALLIEQQESGRPQL